MKILSLETSSNNCSIAIIDENHIIADFNLNIGTTHSQNLLPMIDNIINFSNMALEDIDVFACSIGPGSFTGLRIGISTIKGFAISLNKPVIGIPSLVGLAYNIPYFDGIICSILDAKNDNIYAAIFEYKNRPVMMGNYISAEFNSLIEILEKNDRKIIFIGDGVEVYKNKLIEIFGNRALFVPHHLNIQSAKSIAKAALDKAFLNEYDDYDSINPLYLKKSQAERMLDLNATDFNL